MSYKREKHALSALSIYETSFSQFIKAVGNNPLNYKTTEVRKHYGSLVLCVVCTMTVYPSVRTFSQQNYSELRILC